MSRESQEQRDMMTGEGDSPRGAGDPDFYGYPGEQTLPLLPPTQTDDDGVTDVPFWINWCVGQS